MAGAPTALLDWCERTQLLSAAQRKEVREVLQRKFPQPEALLQELLRRGWLTPFQARMLTQGRAAQLQLGPYLLLDQLGEGASGQVFKARHQKLGRLTALKVLRRDLARDTTAVDRFYREIEVASQVSHPHLVHAYEAGPIGNDLVLAMEYVEGLDLERLVQRHGALPPDLACEYVRQAADGLQHAHERGLVHRDIKPSNLLVSGGANGRGHGDDSTVLSGQLAQQVKILDLGLARLHRYTAGSKTSNLTVLDGNSVMQGTPDYMSPEQALDFHGADIRADIYSLGCTLYFLLAGQPPFPSGRLAEKLMRHQQTEPDWTAIRQPLPSGLLPVLQKMLAKRPPDRYQTPGDVAAALRPWCGNTAITAAKPRTQIVPSATPTQVNRRRRWPWLVGLSAALLLLMGTGLALLVGGRGQPVAQRPIETTPIPSDTRPSPASARTTPTPAEKPTWVASFRGQFQVPTPAPGWQYLWNSKGAVGNPAHYSPLVPGGTMYNLDGVPMQPRPDPAGYVYLARNVGHPGRGAAQAGRFDRCAIAAYTLQDRHAEGEYALVQSRISGGNVLRLIVHVNDRPAVLNIEVPKAARNAAFDTGLGRMRAGDTVYVAIGASGHDGGDTFTDLDFVVARGTPAPLARRRDVLFATGFEEGLTGWTNRGMAERELDADQPHLGKQSFRISVARESTLQYQQIWRYVDEAPLAGNRYRASLWVRTKDVNPGETGAYGFLEFLDGQTRIELEHTRVNPKNGTNGWEQLTVEATAPPGVKQVRFGLVLQAHATAWFDDVEVARETIFSSAKD